MERDETTFLQKQKNLDLGQNEHYNCNSNI